MPMDVLTLLKYRGPIQLPNLTEFPSAIDYPGIACVNGEYYITAQENNEWVWKPLASAVDNQILNLIAGVLDTRYGSLTIEDVEYLQGLDPIINNKISTAIAGIPTGATHLTTPRAIAVTGDVTDTSVNFDGTGNVSLDIDILPAILLAKLLTVDGASSGIHAEMASRLATTRTITLTGDVTGSVSTDMGGNVSMTTVVGDDSHSHSNYLGISASAVSAGKLATARTVSLTGDVTGSVSTDLSANAAIASTLANSGVTAGTYNNVATQVRPFTVDAKGRITAVGSAVTIAPAFSAVTGKPTTLAGYGIGDSIKKGGFGAYTNTNDIISLGWSTDDKLKLHVNKNGTQTNYEHNFPIDITGNAASATTATRLVAARTFALTGDVTGSVSSDLSGNVSITTVVTDNSHNHTTYALLTNNLSDLPNKTTARTNLGLGTVATLNTGTTAGTIPVRDASSNVVGNITGNASTATKLATARTITLAGDVTGSASFDGSANVSITATVADDSHTHSNYMRNDGDSTTTGYIRINRTGSNGVYFGSGAGSYLVLDTDNSMKLGVGTNGQSFNLQTLNASGSPTNVFIASSTETKIRCHNGASVDLLTANNTAITLHRNTELPSSYIRIESPNDRCIYFGLTDDSGIGKDPVTGNVRLHSSGAGKYIELWCRNTADTATHRSLVTSYDATNILTNNNTRLTVTDSLVTVAAPLRVNYTGSGLDRVYFGGGDTFIEKQTDNHMVIQNDTADSSIYLNCKNSGGTLQIAQISKASGTEIRVGGTIRLGVWDTLIACHRSVLIDDAAGAGAHTLYMGDNLSFLYRSATKHMCISNYNAGKANILVCKNAANTADAGVIEAYYDQTIFRRGGNDAAATMLHLAQDNVVYVNRWMRVRDYGANGGTIFLGEGDVFIAQESVNGDSVYVNGKAGKIHWFNKSMLVSGDITAYGNITAYSDARLKKDVKPIENALDKIQLLNGVTFNRVSDDKPGVGVLAQDVQQVFPELVSEDKNGNLSVAYGNLVAPLIEAVKALTARVTELEEQLKGK